MSSNVYKANFIQFSPENTKVIDTNSLVAKRLEGFSGVYREATDEPMEEGEDYGYDATDELLADRDGLSEEQMEASEEGFQRLNPEVVDVSEYEVSPQDMIAKAEEEIEMKRQAMLQRTEEERAITLERAQSDGYAAGRKIAEEEYGEKLSQLDDERKKLQKEYEELVENLEPRMVDVITNIYSQVFGDHFYSNRDVMINLISKALFHVGNENDIIIHVSTYDYDMLLGCKDKLFDASSYGKAPEIRVEDELIQGQCKVETAYGIIDCGVDTELKELTRMLKVLSYEG